VSVYRLRCPCSWYIRQQKQCDTDTQAPTRAHGGGAEAGAATPRSSPPQGCGRPAYKTATSNTGSTSSSSSSSSSSTSSSSSSSSGSESSSASDSGFLVPWSCSDASLMQLIASRDPTGQGVGGVAALRLLQRLLHWDPAQVGWGLPGWLGVIRLGWLAAVDAPSLS